MMPFIFYCAFIHICYLLNDIFGLTLVAISILTVLYYIVLRTNFAIYFFFNYILLVNAYFFKQYPKIASMFGIEYSITATERSTIMSWHLIKEPTLCSTHMITVYKVNCPLIQN